MQKVLEQLVALQELDTRLDELISKLGDLPETVKTLEIQIDNEKEQNEVRKRSIEENAELARGKNIIVEEENAKIGRYKDQLYLVTTNKEYDALNSQIEFSENEVRDAKSIIEQAGEEQERLKE